MRSGTFYAVRRRGLVAGAGSGSWLGGVFLLCLSVPVAPAQAQWTQWGGPSGDFTAPASGLADTWGENGPKLLWSRALGDGFSSILEDDKRLYTTYRRREEEVVICLDARDGKTIWEYAYTAHPAPGHLPLFRNGKGPHATPLIVEDHIYSVGIAGTLICLDKRDGTFVWKRELWGELGGQTLDYGYSASPISFRDLVIVLVGGDKRGLVAFDRRDGRIRWSTKGLRVNYSTPRLIEVDKRAHLVAVLQSEVVGVDPSNGAIEWRQPLAINWDESIAPPLWDAERKLLVASVHVGGARCFRLELHGEAVKAELIWENRKIQFYNTTPVLVDGWIYGMSHTSPSFLLGADVTTGKIAWRMRSADCAMCVRADGRLLLQFEDGRLAMVKASPAGPEVLSEVRLFRDQGNSWAVPTVVGQKLYARDNDIIVALDLR